MKIKSIMHKLFGVLMMVPLLPEMAHAFQVSRPNRMKYDQTPQEHFETVWAITMEDITILGVVFALVTIAFMVMYRRRGHGERGKWPHLSKQAKLGWLVIPVALFLADDLYLFVKGWDLHNHYREVPANAYEIKVTGSTFNWNYQYPNGVETDGELRVPVGQPILLRMISEDVIHSHYINKMHVTEDLMRGRVTYQWIMPTEKELGESVITCREYCGSGHSGMYGKLIVMKKDAFDRWLVDAAANASNDADDASRKVAGAPKNKLEKI